MENLLLEGLWLAWQARGVPGLRHTSLIPALNFRVPGRRDAPVAQDWATTLLSVDVSDTNSSLFTPCYSFFPIAMRILRYTQSQKSLPSLATVEWQLR